MHAPLLFSKQLCANKCLEQLINSVFLFDPVFLSLVVWPYGSPGWFPVCLCWFDRAFIYSKAGEEQCSDPYLIRVLSSQGCFIFKQESLCFVISDKASINTQSSLTSSLKSLAEKLILGQIFIRVNITKI